MYASYAQSLCTSYSAQEPGGCSRIALLLDALHEQSADQPLVERVDPRQLPLLRPLAAVYAFSYAVYALTLPY
jgi:hypothetical protein